MLFTMPNSGTMGRLWWALLTAAGATVIAFRVPTVFFEKVHGAPSIGVPALVTLVFLWRFCSTDNQMSMTKAKVKLPDTAPIKAICHNKVLADVLSLAAITVYGWMRWFVSTESGHLVALIVVLVTASLLIRYSNWSKIRGVRKIARMKGPLPMG